MGQRGRSTCRRTGASRLVAEWHGCLDHFVENRGHARCMAAGSRPSTKIGS